MVSSAGDVLREARKRARLSQTDVARRAGIAQSVISTYESGRREPGVHSLTRLVQATGHRLELDIVPAPDFQLGLPDTALGRRLRRRRRTIIETAANCGARHVRVFGSVARGEDTSTSDIDLVVDLDRVSASSRWLHSSANSPPFSASTSTLCRPRPSSRGSVLRSSPRRFRCEPTRRGAAGRHRCLSRRDRIAPAAGRPRRRPRVRRRSGASHRDRRSGEGHRP